MMVGDKRKYNTCLVSLRAVGATGEQPGTDDLDGDALLVNPEVKTVSAAMKDAAFRKHIHDVIVATNKDPKVRGANLPGPACPAARSVQSAPAHQARAAQVCISNACTIQKFEILPADFSVESGELTATLKLKRSVAEEKWKEYVEKMY